MSMKGPEDLFILFSNVAKHMNVRHLFRNITCSCLLVAVIEPVAAQARLIVCTENGFTLPKVFADFTIEEIEVLLSRQQVGKLTAGTFGLFLNDFALFMCMKCHASVQWWASVHSSHPL